MEKEIKFLMLSLRDIDRYLNDEAIAILTEFCHTIQAGRALDGKQDHIYVCVKDTWPMYAYVGEMVDDYLDNKQSDGDDSEDHF